MSDSHKPLELKELSREDLEKLTQRLYVEKLEADREKLHDDLTKLGNRRKLMYDYSRISERKGDGIVGLLMVDIDFFKPINDKYGHAIGDWALERFAVEITAPLRASDTPYRIGGEEFVVLVLPHGSENQGSSALEIKALADRLREHIEKTKWWKDGVPAFTVSIGYSQGTYSTSIKSLLAEADRALYRAKKHGRNMAEPGTGLLPILKSKK